MFDYLILYCVTAGFFFNELCLIFRRSMLYPQDYPGWIIADNFYYTFLKLSLIIIFFGPLVYFLFKFELKLFLYAFLVLMSGVILNLFLQSIIPLSLRIFALCASPFWFLILMIILIT